MSYLLHDVFLKTAERLPEKIAIKEEDGKTLTYKELNCLANKFAQSFLFYKTNTRDNPFIGILSSVHGHSIAAVLGALKIGCAYVPLDEHSPTERLLHILENTKLDILVIDPVWALHHHALLSYPTLKKVIFLDYNQLDIQALGNVLPFDEVTKYPSTDHQLLNKVSDDLAYILHTSGSTGIPKGIMLTHRNARTFVDWMHKEFNLTSKDIVMSRAPFKFDLSVFDIFNTFKAGACLVCYNWNRKRAQDKKHKDYVSLMERENVTVFYTTPSTFIMLMNHGDFKTANLALNRVMYAGEPFPVPQLRRLQSFLPNARIANIYGPTETNIITYYWIEQIHEDTDSIPLGNVVEDTEIIVVSENQQKICEPYEVGELWCRGGTVTIGYFGMPEKTKECLVKSPFHAYPCLFWRTGDYGFYDDQGLLHYRGRRDHMIKVKGYRIEIGEIESALAQFEGLDEFAVIAAPHASYGNELFGFFSRLAGAAFTAQDIIIFLQKKIPPYMIPSNMVELENLPKTSSGKVDRILLKENLIPN
jgi:amino acid adenylation domain-containing protein